MPCGQDGCGRDCRRTPGPDATVTLVATAPGESPVSWTRPIPIGWDVFCVCAGLRDGLTRSSRWMRPVEARSHRCIFCVRRPDPAGVGPAGAVDITVVDEAGQLRRPESSCSRGRRGPGHHSVGDGYRVHPVVPGVYDYTPPAGTSLALCRTADGQRTRSTALSLEVIRLLETEGGGSIDTHAPGTAPTAEWRRRILRHAAA